MGIGRRGGFPVCLSIKGPAPPLQPIPPSPALPSSASTYQRLRSVSYSGHRLATEDTDGQNSVLTREVTLKSLTADTIGVTLTQAVWARGPR